MIFLFLVQCATVCIIFMINPRQEVNRLFVFFLFFAFSVDLFWAIVDSILPYLPSQLDGAVDINVLLLRSHFNLDMVGNPGAAYTFLMFAIAVSRMVNQWIWRVLAITLYLPVLFSTFNILTQGVFDVDYSFLLKFVTPYYIVAIAFLIIAIVRADNQLTRRNRIIIAALTIPPVLIYVILYFLQLEPQQVSMTLRYLRLYIGVAFLIFLFFVFKYGILGVRIRLQKQVFDSTLKAISTGSEMLHHAIKNRMINIQMLASRMENSFDNGFRSRLVDDIDLIKTESDTVLKMLYHIKRQTEDYEMTYVHMDVKELLDETLQIYQPRLDDRGIKMRKHFEYATSNLLGDRTHLQEVFGNLIINAMEAMEKDKGELIIRVTENKRYMLIEFGDNGKGIKTEDLQEIFTPFYSTKNKERNYGLGLSYCYRIVRKHGGKIYVQSEEAKGSTFFLQLPKGKSFSVTESVTRRSVAHGVD